VADVSTNHRKGIRSKFLSRNAGIFVATQTSEMQCGGCTGKSSLFCLTNPRCPFFLFFGKEKFPSSLEEGVGARFALKSHCAELRQEGRQSVPKPCWGHPDCSHSPKKYLAMRWTLAFDRTHNRIRSPRFETSGQWVNVDKGSRQNRLVTSGQKLALKVVEKKRKKKKKKKKRKKEGKIKEGKKKKRKKV